MIGSQRRQATEWFALSVKAAGASLIMVCLAACSTLGPAASARFAAVDYFHDDLSTLVIAIDAPAKLVPIPNGSRFSLTVKLADGTEDEVTASMVRAVTADISGRLPTPNAARSFFLLEIDDQSAEDLAEFQQRVRQKMAAASEASPGGSHSIGLTFGFCTLSPIIALTETFSAFATLPGEYRLEPVIEDQNLGQFLLAAGQGQDLPACADVL